MTVFWGLTGSDKRPYSLCLDSEGNWYIWDDEKREKVLVYLQPLKKWFGRYNGKAIILEWPSFRDMIEQFIFKKQMIDSGSRKVNPNPSVEEFNEVPDTE